MLYIICSHTCTLRCWTNGLNQRTRVQSQGYASSSVYLTLIDVLSRTSLMWMHHLSYLSISTCQNTSNLFGIPNQAIDRRIQYIVTPPVLAIPNNGLHYSIFTDASYYQVGAAIFKPHPDGDWHWNPSGSGHAPSSRYRRTIRLFWRNFSQCYGTWKLCAHTWQGSHSWYTSTTRPFVASFHCGYIRSLHALAPPIGEIILSHRKKRWSISPKIVPCSSHNPDTYVSLL